jgi:hypothetical protein
VEPPGEEGLRCHFKEASLPAELSDKQMFSSLRAVRPNHKICSLETGLSKMEVLELDESFKAIKVGITRFLGNPKAPQSMAESFCEASSHPHCQHHQNHQNQSG